MTRYTMSEEQRAEIEQARKQNRDKRIEKRLQVLSLRAEGKKLVEIAEITGFHRSHVSGLIAAYQKGGLSAITANQYKGNRRNMSVEDEEELLKPFKEEAAKGHIVEVSAIKAAYDQAVGHTSGNRQIYYVLHRHGWRKVMPRSQHPKKASKEVIETSKKLTSE